MRLASFLIALVVLAGAVALVAADRARSIGRGIVDNRLEYLGGVDAVAIPGLTDDIGSSGLRARWTRVLIHWPRLQPYAPGVPYAGDADGDGYDDAYVAELNAIVTQLTAKGVTVIATPTEVPLWASDRSLWSSSGYSTSYAMDVGDADVLAAFGRLGGFLAGGLAVPLKYLECWNEPNTAGTFYPQRLPDDKKFAMRVYIKMLRSFHEGAHAVLPDAVVIAGATAPRGADDVDSTAPRTFAAYLRAQGASAYFEAYSHHPYCWDAPDAAPRDKRAVWLANLGELTRLFPGKPFFLTEFGYGTHTPTMIGLKVSPATQARWLREAYTYVRRKHPQVKALLWFMVQDLPPAPDRLGAYMGLRTVGGARKPSWFAFAGGNSLTLAAPSSVATSTRFTLNGALSSRVTGGLTGKTVFLQRRTLKDTSWTRIAKTRTGSGGSFAFRARQGRGTRLYRVVWDGVCEGRAVRVRSR